MQSPRMLAEQLRTETATDLGRGSIARISNDFGPQDPAVDDGLDMSAAREHVPRGRVAPLTEASFPPVGTTVACARLHWSDSYVPDCWPPSAGVLVPPVGTTVHCARFDCSDLCVPECFPELLESIRNTEEGLSVAVDVALPEVFPVGFAGAAVVPVSLPAVAVAVSSAVFAGGGGVAVDAAPLAEEGTVTVGVTVLMDTGCELPAELLEYVHVTEDCLSVDVALPEVSPAVFAGGGCCAGVIACHYWGGVLGRFCWGGRC